MAYCTQSDLEGASSEQELIDLTDRTSSGQVDSARVAQAIADADAWINIFVAKQRAVPLSPVPGIIQRYSVQQALYLLRQDRNAVTDRDEQAMVLRREDLSAIAGGKVTLGVDPQPAKSALVRPAVVAVGDGDRELTACSTKGIW
jgi:phage gp36-like protein